MTQLRGIGLSDTHCGSVYGLWNTRYEFEDPRGGAWKLNHVQRLLWKYWKEFIEFFNHFKPDFLILNGDLIDGSNRYKGGMYCITTNLNDQKKNFEACIKPLNLEGVQVFGTCGSDYHEAKQFNTNREIVEDLGGEFWGYNNFVELETGHTMHVTHGSTQAYIYIEQVLGRERLFSMAAETAQKVPPAEIHYYGHLHKWLLIRSFYKPDKVRMRDKIIVVGPGFQAQDEYMIRKSPYKLIPEIGCVSFTLVTDNDPWIDRLVFKPIIIKKDIARIRKRVK